jgi:hypothetical protein
VLLVPSCRFQVLPSLAVPHPVPTVRPAKLSWASTGPETVGVGGSSRKGAALRRASSPGPPVPTSARRHRTGVVRLRPGGWTCGALLADPPGLKGDAMPTVTVGVAVAAALEGVFFAAVAALGGTPK